MLQLKNVTKVYDSAMSPVQALRGVSIEFRESEFVSILGPSGCGKTTLLNIIGGLDRYTDGDLIINGKSTKDFHDRDWDTYRNHSVGFVFQSYNLIPHQTVLANVELALTLSGVSKAERRRRAEDALRRVGLGDQMKKKPNQMSGGQMQRVAIARAIVNDPDILLADEPTGALDTATSIQIMEILKEIAKDKLVIMVTHNPQLAEQYSTRIVRLLDGVVTDDSAPIRPDERGHSVVRKTAVSKGKKTSMSFLTALSLSLNNLMTKKGRTFMTVFAGSIGIIGIALILSLSSGINSYIETVQKDTLSAYPIQVNRQSMDLTTMMANMMNHNSDNVDYSKRDPDKIYSSNILSDMMTSMSEGVSFNNMAGFKQYLDSTKEFQDKNIVSAVQYTYDLTMNIYKQDTSAGILQVNPSTVMAQMMAMMGLTTSTDSVMSSITQMSGFNVWSEMLDNQTLLDSQYELLDPATMHWPKSYDEVVVVVNKHNELSDVALYALGLRDSAELTKLMQSLQKGETYEVGSATYTFDDLLNLSYSVVLPADLYVKNEDGTYTDKRKNETFLKEKIADGIKLKVVGIVRAKDGAVSTSISGTIGYTHALTEFVALANARTELVRAQTGNEKTNVITGQEFDAGQYSNLSDADKVALFRRYAAGLLNVPMSTDDKSRALISLMSGMTPEERENLLNSLSEEDRRQLFDNLEDFSGYTDSQLIGYISLKGANHPSITAGITETLFKDESKMVSLCGTQAFKDYLVLTLPEAQREQFAAQLAGMSGQEVYALLKQLESMGGGSGSGSGSNPGMPEMSPALKEAYDKVTTVALGMLSREELLTFANRIAEAELFDSLENMSGQKEQMALIFDSVLPTLPDEQVLALYDDYMPELVSKLSYDEVMKELGAVDLDNPAGINIYAASFEAKDTIQSLIDAYNKSAEEEGRESDVISYTDLVGIMMSFFTDVINAISYVLIAFVSISLVVSSIMIGIITYISVLERTKEIGILRAMGASKHDVSRVFNAETMLIGVTAGLFGVLVTVLLCFPINLIIRHVTGIPILTASLPFVGGLVLVIVSILLTTLAGLIPSLGAAKKDPVVALRTE